MPCATTHHMPADSAVRILQRLADGGVGACLGGGWAVDALLGQQTREHSDLDLWIAATDADGLFSVLADLGIDRIYPWPGDRPWNFVLHDGGRLRLDLHFYERLDDGACHYGSVLGNQRFPADALTGRGRIAGVAVRCEEPAWSVRWHTGYPVRTVDRHDVPMLCERFGLALPEEYLTTELVDDEPTPSPGPVRQEP
jgi:lincosamide nucleotidyltransferase A/C/D/E